MANKSDFIRINEEIDLVIPGGTSIYVHAQTALLAYLERRA